MKTEGIDHVVIAVKDLEKARKFFSDLLDTTFEDLGVVHELGGTHSIMSPEGLEIVAPETPDAPLAKYIETAGEGVMAISFRVKDEDLATKEAEKHGLKVIGRIDRDLGSFKGFKEVILHPKGACNTQLTFAEYESRGFKG